jgi:hypothetical protein
MNKGIIFNDGNYMNTYYTNWLLDYVSKERGYEVTHEELQKEFVDLDYLLGINGQLYVPKNIYAWYVGSKYDIIKYNDDRLEIVYQLRPKEEI